MSGLIHVHEHEHVLHVLHALLEEDLHVHRGEVGHVKLLLHADSRWLKTLLSDSLSFEFHLYSLKDVTKWWLTRTSPIPVDHASSLVWLQNASEAKMEQMETDLSMQYSDLLGIHSSSL